jgi:TATA-box binding protein (TBP) (component of TFIID and TFIIIB)
MEKMEELNIKIDESLSSEALKYTEFKDVPIFALTIISVSNLKFNLSLMYQYLPYTDYVVVKKKRGRKKKVETVNPNQHIPPGSIISIRDKTNVRGSILKESKKDKKTYFLNSIAIVMILENGKKVNSKISQNGKFQITGCKNIEQCIEMIRYLFKHIREIEVQTGQSMFSLKYGSKSTNRNPTFVFKVVMKNIYFKLDFNINREKLNQHINDNTDYCSSFEIGIDTGVNIKVKSKQPYENELDSIEILPDLTINRSIVPFKYYNSFLDEKEQKKEIKKESYHTFLVFHSGSIIQSGSGPDMGNVYNKFISILLSEKKHFEEILNIDNKQDIEKMQTVYNLKPGRKKITRNKNELDLSKDK